MGVFVFLPLVLPLTAWPIARLAEQHLHPRTATRLLTGVAAVMAACSTLCLGLVMVVGTAQLPGNPLPDGWSDPEVRAAVPYDEVVGKAAIPALCAVVVACARTLWRHGRVRRRAHRALTGLPGTEVAVLPDELPYAYALPGGHRGRVVVTTGLLDHLEPAERRALFAHERAHLAAGHHRFLLTVQLAARANPFLRPLRTAVSYTAERWADEEAARVVGHRRTVASAVGRAALVSGGVPVVTLAGFAGRGPEFRRGDGEVVRVVGHRRTVGSLVGRAALVSGGAPVVTLAGFAGRGPEFRRGDGEAARVVGHRRTVGSAVGRAAMAPGGSPVVTLAGFAAPGPVPRRVAALLGPAPAVRRWPSLFTSVGLAAWCAAAGTAVSAMSSANAAVTMVLILRAATPL